MRKIMMKSTNPFFLVSMIALLFTLTHCGDSKELPPGAEDVSACLFFDIGCDDLADKDDVDDPDDPGTDADEGGEGDPNALDFGSGEDEGISHEPHLSPPTGKNAECFHENGDPCFLDPDHEEPPLGGGSNR
jgi:hypothetical protein